MYNRFIFLSVIYCLFISQNGCGQLPGDVQTITETDESRKDNPMSNRLANETSPYLLQHKDNPVNWYPWGEEALQKAKAENKPIFLSVGYSACHWCHVMEHESFENEATAAIMNEHFICIKVDREERPDIDEIYMNAVQMMTGQGGWPMSVFLTPDLKPFYGGTYYPPRDMYGRPGFPTVLNTLANAWKERKDEIVSSAEQLTEQIQHSFTIAGEDQDINIKTVDTGCQQVVSRFDKYFGGFGGAPKFPHSMDISLLLRYYHRAGKADVLHAIEFSLEKMALGGIYDQIGGGFHRYATDAKWLIPHFEKMLYDNALLAVTYTEAYQLTKKPLYEKTVRETLDYVLREMTSPEGGFYSSQDADSEGEEGKFFIWSPDEIYAVSGEEHGKIVCAYYDVTQAGNFEHGKSVLSIPKEEQTIAEQFSISVDELRKRIQDANQKLMAEREKRVKPGRDDKTLADWNGLMISAMAFAGNVFQEQRYKDAAVKACEFAASKLWNNESNRLWHTYKDGRAHTNGFLSDYANLAAGMLDTYEAVRDPKWLKMAVQLTDAMIANFWDETNGGFFYTGNDHETLIARTKNPMDNAVPSGNSTAAMVLLRLGEMTGNAEYKEKAHQTFSAFSALISQMPSAFTHTLSAMDFHLSSPKEIVLSAEDEEDLQTFQQALFSRFMPNKVVIYNTKQHRETVAELSAIVEGKQSIEEKTTAYVCENFTCQLPVTAVDDFIQQLDIDPTN